MNLWKMGMVVVLGLVCVVNNLQGGEWITYLSDQPGEWGQWIVFLSDEGGENNFWRMRPDGSGKSQLTDQGVDVFDFFSPSPNGRYVAFMSPNPNNDEFHKDLYMLDITGLNVLQLVNSGHGYGGVSWSVDGRYIYYHFQPGNYCDMDAYRFDLQDSTYEFLYDGPEVWPGKNEIYTLTERPPYGDYYATWAQDGCWAPTAEIFIFTPDLSEVTRVTNDTDDDHNPFWSPDGQKIAWTIVNGPYEPGPDFREIRVSNLDGTEVDTVLHWDGNPGVMCLGWSPDGQWILFSSNIEGNWELYKLNPFGYNDYVNLTNTPEINEIKAVWSILIGDANDDGLINYSDLSYLGSYLFLSGPPPIPIESGDVNGDCMVNVADLIFLGNYLFSNGPPPIPCLNTKTLKEFIQKSSFQKERSHIKFYKKIIKRSSKIQKKNHN